MRALVVGASGFVGTHLVSHLLERGDEVVIGTRDGSASREGCSAVVLDITDAVQSGAALQRARADVVFHLAGISFVPQAESDFDRALLVNVAGTSNLVRNCHLLGSKISFLFTSSSEVYGHVIPAELPITEDTPIRPANNYSLSKRMAEMVVERYSRMNTVKCVIARPFNHIGPGQDSRFVVSNFALQLARIARGEAPPVLQVGNLEARRDFSDVRDIVRAYVDLALKGSGVYNLGSGEAHSIQSILEKLIVISRQSVEIQKDPARMRGPEVPELRCSYLKATQDIGWSPKISLQESLEAVYRYWFDQVPSAVG